MVERVTGEVVGEELAEPRAPSEVELAALAIGLARLAAGMWWRTTRWSAEVSAQTAMAVIRAAMRGESVTDVLQDAGTGLRDWLREVLGVDDIEQRVRQTLPQSIGLAAANGAGPDAAAPDQVVHTLRERGAALLKASADLTWDEAAHPAYERILGSLAPDEARILRLLYVKGPQPSVDVRTGLVGPTSKLVAAGLNMVGQEAGCRYLDRVPAYLNNLERLGLIWFSREQLEDRMRYQVLEAQPDVVDALRRQGRGRTVRRSIHLTPFGEDFCSVCLPLDVTGEMDVPAPPSQPERRR